MIQRLFLKTATCTFALIALLAGSLLFTSHAYAITAAEKHAEADEISKYIDSLQTGLNEMRSVHDKAEAAYDEAVALRDEASQKIEEQSARVNELEDKMSSFAVSMYKSDGAGMFLGLLLQTTNFTDFLVSVDRCAAITDSGKALLAETKAAREELEKAQAEYELQAKRAEQQIKISESSMKQIEDTQNALREEVEKLAEEAAELEELEKAKEEEEKKKDKKEAKEGKSSKKEQDQEVSDEDARQAEEDRIAKEAEIEERVQKTIAAAVAASASANAEVDAVVLLGEGYFTNPCPTASESSGFGYRDFDSSFHKGVDMAAPEGTPYYAADNGTVLYATSDGGYNGGAGNWVVISHGNGVVTKYMHSLITFVQPGDQVVRGQNIGLVGSTGNSTGPHLHFQVEVDGVAVNPTNYI